MDYNFNTFYLPKFTEIDNYNNPVLLSLLQFVTKVVLVLNCYYVRFKSRYFLLTLKVCVLFVVCAFTI